MRTLQAIGPRQELSEFVQAYAQRDIACGDEEFSQPNIATLEQVLAFELHDCMTIEHSNDRSELCPLIPFWGAMTPPCGGSRFAGHVVGFAIFLKPTASWQLFRIPPNAIANTVCDGGHLLGGAIRDLWYQLAESKTFSERVRLTEECLMSFAIKACAPTPMMKTARLIRHLNGATRIDTIAYQSVLSARQYQRRFVEEIGLNPKLFARITRFERVIDAKRLAPHRSWMSIAHQFGYFDQMHMVKDFQSLGGSTPSKILQQSGDLQPWSVASPNAVQPLPILCSSAFDLLPL